MKKYFAFLLFLFLSGKFLYAVPPDTSFCSRLNYIVDAASDSGFTAIRGNEQKQENYTAFSSKFSILGKGAIIYYNSEWKKLVYKETIAGNGKTPATLDLGESLLKKESAKVGKCLTGTDWVPYEEKSSQNRYYLFKNIKTRVFVLLDLLYSGDQISVNLSVYLQNAASSGCVNGDCLNGHGTYVYENGDMYEGDFFEGVRNGYGTYTHKGDLARYTGGWLNDVMNGYGLFYDEKGNEISRGYVLEGNAFNLDTTKINTCNAGVCGNGWGAVYFSTGDIYVGEFKNRRQEGFGMFQTKGGSYYGQFRTGLYDGYGIVYFPEGASYRGIFIAGVQRGPGIEKTSSGHSIEGIYNNDKFQASEFDEKGIFIRKGFWVGEKFTPSLDSTAASLEAFGSALRKTLALKSDNLPKLLGKKIEKSDDYISNFPFPGYFSTVIKTSPVFGSLVDAILTQKPSSKEDAIKKYQSQIDFFRSLLSADWIGSTKEVSDKGDSAFRIYEYSNVQNKQSRIIIKVAFNKVEVLIY